MLDDGSVAVTSLDMGALAGSCLRKQAGREAALPMVLTCNHLRHTFAIHAADRHGKIITRALMGHQHLATTSVYTHLSPRHFQGLMNRHPYQLQIEKGDRHA